MSPRTFIHFNGSTALVADLSSLTGPNPQTTAVECLTPVSWATTLGPWFAARGLDLVDVLPSPGATNSPEAPSWASVPDRLLSDLRTRLPTLARIVVMTTVSVRREGGEFWLVGDSLHVRVPRCLLADIDQRRGNRFAA